MEMRSFGDGVSVSVLGIGCGRVGSVSNPVAMREIEATLEAAVDAGVNLFDTADIYGQGDSERTLARLLRRHRELLFVVTKVGGRHGRYAGAIRAVKPLLRLIARSHSSVRAAVVNARTATIVYDFSPADLRPAVDASRRRLGLDRLHGLLLHSPSVETLRNPEIHAFLEEVVRDGKAARVGATVDSAEALEAAITIPVLTMLQAPIDVMDAVAGSQALETIRARRIGVFVHQVLRRSDRAPGERPSPRAALAAALTTDRVTAALVGVSTRQHFRELAASVP